MQTTTHHNRMTCEEILARLSEDDLEDLEGWRSIENADSVHLGGRGHTAWQIEAARRAWDALSPDAQNAFFDMRRSVVDDLIAAIRKVGIPDTDRDIDAITALLGHDHPSFRIMPAYALVDAYAEAMEAMEKDAITIKITPSLGVVFYLSDLVDTEKALWLGEEVPSSAAPRLARLQKIATKRILGEVPGSVVEWSAESVHKLGGHLVHVSIDDDADEGFSHALLEGRVKVILHQEIANIVKAILNREG